MDLHLNICDRPTAFSDGSLLGYLRWTVSQQHASQTQDSSTYEAAPKTTQPGRCLLVGSREAFQNQGGKPMCVAVALPLATDFSWKESVFYNVFPDKTVAPFIFIFLIIGGILLKYYHHCIMEEWSYLAIIQPKLCPSSSLMNLSSYLKIAKHTHILISFAPNNHCYRQAGIITTLSTAEMRNLGLGNIKWLVQSHPGSS